MEADDAVLGVITKGAALARFRDRPGFCLQACELLAAWLELPSTKAYSGSLFDDRCSVRAGILVHGCAAPLRDRDPPLP